jgi:hypothetical protein
MKRAGAVMVLRVSRVKLGPPRRLWVLTPTALGDPDDRLYRAASFAALV